MAHSLRQLSYLTLDVFTTMRYLGNPLALVLIPPSEELDTHDMQRIAREFNYSETVFLYENDNQEDLTKPEWKFRIFLVDAEVPFAGHPAIGTASYVLSMMQSKNPSATIEATLHCKAGPIDISLDSYGEGVKAVIPNDFHLHTEEAVTKQQVLDVQPGLREDAIRAIDIVSPVKGMNFMVVELVDLETLATVTTNGRRPDLVLDQGWTHGFLGTAYYVRTDTIGNKKVYRTRMIESILEDPATGSMSCGLATLLATKGGMKSAEFVFTQGVEMGRQSDIGVSVSLNDDLKTVKLLELKGNAVRVMEGSILR